MLPFTVFVRKINDMSPSFKDKIHAWMKLDSLNLEFYCKVKFQPRKIVVCLPVIAYLLDTCSLKVFSLVTFLSFGSMKLTRS